MQMDTRRLSVAADHLRAALEEITRAQGQAEQSMAQASACQALSHMDLLLRRLEAERHVNHKNHTNQTVEHAFEQAQQAWQAIHDAINDWDGTHARALDQARNGILNAIQDVEEITEAVTSEEKIHA